MRQVRGLDASLVGPLRDFFGRVPESDHNFFAEDVFAPGLIEAWLNDSRGRRALALDGGADVAAADEAADAAGANGGAHANTAVVVGYVAVVPLVGWSSHVGNLRVVVDPAVRGRGVGRALSRYGLRTGLEMRLTKLVVEAVADALPAIGMFESLGFEPEALLRDHVRDRSGTMRDLVVLSHLVGDTWSEMATAGIEEALWS